ncbi:MAG: NAD(P)-binding protein [Granulosicoccus sp.]|nr:NAD(P)-binding protein [Granulosicoccus sp.]
MARSPDDMARNPDLKTLRTTGAQRLRQPRYVDLLPPCNDACPAGEDIQAWLALAQAGEYEAAWRSLIRHNPMPAVHGRVCYHPCETACNRRYLDSTVSIHAVERFLGDLAITNDWQVTPDAPPTGKRVLVIGAGPSGLSAAYHLARFGHSVEIHEAGPMAGGMMHFGIPAYRLPRAELDAEIHRIERLGVRIVLDHPVTDLDEERRNGQFDAVFVAVGAHISKRTDIPARDAGKMFDAVSFLQDVETGNAPRLGRRVAIYGGGNTAMDAARTARRMGVDEAFVIYRRDRDHMPAHEFEADEAQQEGIHIHWLRTIKFIDQSTFTVEVMELDQDGRPRGTGRTETLQADSLIMALGQDVDTSFMKQVNGIEFKADGTVAVDQCMMTGAAGVFAGGDMVPDERTVTVATGHGKRAARHIDAWLGGKRHRSPPRHEIVHFEKLHVWYSTDAAQRKQPELAAGDRTSSFEEVVAGLNEHDARYEAQRCLSCGNCFECDGCYAACPSDAIVKLGVGKGYHVDLDRCTGCAVCFEQCPCHAIEMITEPSADA